MTNVTIASRLNIRFFSKDLRIKVTQLVHLEIKLPLVCANPSPEDQVGFRATALQTEVLLLPSVEKK